MGDPAGVGPEICLRALREKSILELCRPVVFGSAAVLGRVGEATGLSAGITTVAPDRLSAGHDTESPTVVDVGGLDADSVEPGVVQACCGQAAFAYIREAIGAAMAGTVDAVVTAPINKESLHAAGIPFPGHTEIFADLTRTDHFCMLQTSDELSAGFVTTHCRYAEVPARLTVDRIVEVIDLTADALLRLRGRTPRLVVCGLNPHAGEHGLFGDEEEQVIVPAIERARTAGWKVEGPLPPDTAFLPALRERTDGYICMYHDQGHIPFKMLAFDTGVNVTLGLPIIRTSVDHGTAFDIAWKGVARPSSLLHAIRLAVTLAQSKKSRIP